jgi:hypothetical protein
MFLREDETGVAAAMRTSEKAAQLPEKAAHKTKSKEAMRFTTFVVDR